jgi:hypothetical protein
MSIRGKKQDHGYESKRYRALVTTIMVNALVPILTRSFLSVEVYKPPIYCNEMIREDDYGNVEGESIPQIESSRAGG